MSLLNRAARVSLVLVGLMAVATPAVATQRARVQRARKKLSSDKVRQVGHVVCGRFFSSRYWVPGTRLKKGYFITHERQAKNYGKAGTEGEGQEAQEAERRRRALSQAGQGTAVALLFPCFTAGVDRRLVSGRLDRRLQRRRRRCGLTCPARSVSRSAIGWRSRPCVRRRRGQRRPRRHRATASGSTWSPSMGRAARTTLSARGRPRLAAS